MSDIQSFLKDKTILVTGATGFVGKTLVEKILRTCDVRKVYITMRSKKNKSVYQRQDEYFESSIFDRLKEEKDGETKKVDMVPADLSRMGLGMIDSDREVLIEEVSVVFHTAATIRFEEPLRVAANTNVRGTQEILKLCLEIKNLASVVYVSSAYSFCTQPQLHEVFHKPPLKASELLAIVDAFNDKVLDAITPTLLGNCPNTYVFTKAIAEDCVQKTGHCIPLSIVRPSIIVSTAEEPFPGWIDNYIGATGVFVGTMLGVIRTLNCKFDNVSDLIPVDYVANCMLAAATKRSTANVDETPIYNCTTSFQNPVTWRRCFDYGSIAATSFPTTLKIWHVIFIPLANTYLYMILHFFLHMIPAYIIDFIAMCLGRKPQVVKGYEKISKYLTVLTFFSLREWIFYNNNTQNLWKRLSETDQKLYNFDVSSLNWKSYFSVLLLGCRKYLLKESIDTVPEGHSKGFKLKIAHYTLITFIVLICIQLSYVFVSRIIN